MKCIVLGHSHLLSLTMASANPGSICQTQDDLSFTFLRIEPSRTPDVSKIMGQLDAILRLDRAPKLIVAVLGGNEHNMLGMLTRRPAFDFRVPETTGPTCAGTHAVPYHAVRATLLTYMRCWLDILDEVARLPHPVAYLQPPRPIESSDFVYRHLDAGFGQISGPEAISSPALRLKLWNCMDDVIRTECAQRGVLYLTPPAQTGGAAGFLSEQALWIDATHANAWYGEQCLQTIRTFALAALAPQQAGRSEH